MKEIKVRNRFNLAVKRALQGSTTGQDIKAIVEYQLREYLQEGDEPFTNEELGLMAYYMTTYN